MNTALCAIKKSGRDLKNKLKSLPLFIYHFLFSYLANYDSTVSLITY